MMRPIIRDSEIHEKTPAANAAAECPAHGNDFRAHNVTANQSTNEPTDESTNEPTKRIFRSMFAKARCALRKPFCFNELRHGRQYHSGAKGYKKSLPERGLRRIRFTRSRPEGLAVRRGGHGEIEHYKEYLPMERIDEGCFMLKPHSVILITVLLCSSILAAPPVRKPDDPGSPPFKVLKSGENPPLDVNGNFVIGPEYLPAPERKTVEGVPQGK